MSAPTRPVLRWHGGKWKLAPWIIAQFPPHRVYVEPFGGAASVLMRKPRAYAEIYNDLDGEVVNLFRVLRDPAGGGQLVRQLELTPFAREEFDLAYEATKEPVERARRLCIRAMMGFGSNGHNISVRTGFRANSNRSGTTPAHDWKNYPPAIAAIGERLQGVIIENRPAIEVMAQHDAPTTLHYVDPPYVLSTRSIGNPYDLKSRAKRSGSAHRSAMYAHEMTDEDHRALVDVLLALAGMVVLSGYPHPIYEQVLGDWRMIETAAHADGARPRTEVLWINPAAVAARRDLLSLAGGAA